MLIAFSLFCLFWWANLKFSLLLLLLYYLNIWIEMNFCYLMKLSESYNFPVHTSSLAAATHWMLGKGREQVGSDPSLGSPWILKQFFEVTYFFYLGILVFPWCNFVLYEKMFLVFKLGAWSYHCLVWWETTTNCCFHLLKIAGSSCHGFCKQSYCVWYFCTWIFLCVSHISSSRVIFVCGLFLPWISGCVFSPSALDTCLVTVAVQLMSLTAHLVLRGTSSPLILNLHEHFCVPGNSVWE